MSNVIQTPTPDAQLTQLRPFASFRTFNELISYVSAQKAVLNGSSLTSAQKRQYATTLVEYLNRWEAQIIESANGKIATIERKSGRNVAASIFGGAGSAVGAAATAGLLATSTAIPIIGAGLALAAGVATLIQKNTLKQLTEQLENLKTEAARLDTLRKEIQGLVGVSAQQTLSGPTAGSSTWLIVIAAIIFFLTR